MANRGKKLAKGSIFRVANLIINVIVTFYLMPFLIHVLGKENYGLWALIGSITSYYFLMDFGISTAIARFVAIAIGEKDGKNVNVVLSTGVKLFFYIGTILIAATCIIVYLLPAFIKHPLILETQFLLSFTAIEVGISLPLRVYLGVFNAHLDFDLVSSSNAIKVIVRALVIYVFLSHGYGLIALGIINSGTNLLFFLFMAVWATKKYKLNVYFSGSSNEVAKRLFHFSKHVFIAQLGGILRFGVDKVVIVTSIGLIPITTYQIAARLIGYFQNIIVQIIGVLSPYFAQLYGADDKQGMKRSFLFGIKISILLSNAVGMGFVIFGKNFITLWMGRNFQDAYPVLVILSVGMTIAQYQSLGVGLLQSMNKHKFFSISNSIEGISNLALSLILVKNYGIKGVALGTAIPMIIIKIFIQPPIMCRALELKISRFLIQICVPLFGSILFFIVGYHFLIDVELTTWLSLFECVTIFYLIYFIYSSIIIFFIERNTLRRFFYE